MLAPFSDSRKIGLRADLWRRGAVDGGDWHGRSAVRSDPVAESLRPQPADLSRRFLVTREFLQLCVGEEHLSGRRGPWRSAATSRA